jgi:hypothetical protein
MAGLVGRQVVGGPDDPDPLELESHHVAHKTRRADQVARQRQAAPGIKRGDVFQPVEMNDVDLAGARGAVAEVQVVDDLQPVRLQRAGQQPNVAPRFLMEMGRELDDPGHGAQASPSRVAHGRAPV